VSGLAGCEGVLIGARLAQGVGAAMMTPAALSILTTSFHTRDDRVKALGAWGGVGAVSGAAGVLFGGVLTSEMSWRWVFFVNLPVVAVILLASFRIIDGERPKAPPLRDFDTVGAGLITRGMLLLVYALVNAPTAVGAQLGLSGTSLAPLCSWSCSCSTSSATATRSCLCRCSRSRASGRPMSFKFLRWPASTRCSFSSRSISHRWVLGLFVKAILVTVPRGGRPRPARRHRLLPATTG
jgi:MFS family permease